MKVIFSLFFIFLYCKQSVANDLWAIDKNISSIEFEVPVLFAKNVTGNFNTFDGFVFVSAHFVNLVENYHLMIKN